VLPVNARALAYGRTASEALRIHGSMAMHAHRSALTEASVPWVLARWTQVGGAPAIPDSALRTLERI
jgi:hypothetical protein